LQTRPWPTRRWTASCTALIASSSRDHPCADILSPPKAPLHERPCSDRRRGSTAPPRARRSVARHGTARRAGSPPWTPWTIRSRLDRPHHAHATYAYVGGVERRDHHAGLLPPVISVITITGIGDHLQPEWLITFTGMRTLGLRRAVPCGHSRPREPGKSPESSVRGRAMPAGSPPPRRTGG
jgi:hypothetical protein